MTSAYWGLVNSMAELDRDRQFLDKWQMYRALVGVNIGPCNLPRTLPGTVDNLMALLDRHQSVYVKPIGGWGGQGIAKVDVIRANGMPHYRWQQQGREALTLRAPDQVAEQFLTSYNGVSTIVQQAAPLRVVDNHMFDIRTLLQRDEDDSWLVSGHAVRLGGTGSVVSNVAISQGTVWPLIRLLQRLQIGPAVRRRITRDIETTGLNIAKTLDAIHPFEEIGLDLGLDTENRLWLIEVNTNDNLGWPDHQLFAKLPNKSTYQQIEARAEARRNALMRDILRELR